MVEPPDAARRVFLRSRVRTQQAQQGQQVGHKITKQARSVHGGTLPLEVERLSSWSGGKGTVKRVPKSCDFCNALLTSSAVATTAEF